MSDPAEQMRALLSAVATLTDAVASLKQTIPAQVAEAAVAKFAADHPVLGRETPSIPAPLKWAGAIVSGVFVSLVTAGLIWMVVTMADMSKKFERVTAQLEQNGAVDLRFAEVNRRIERIESYHAKGQEK